MDIIVVAHKDINVNSVMRCLYGNTKKKEKFPKHRDKKKILDCYAEGMGIRSLCRVFKVATKTLKKWIASEGKEFKQPDISEEKFVSCDKIWNFIQKKKQKV